MAKRRSSWYRMCWHCNNNLGEDAIRCRFGRRAPHGDGCISFSNYDVFARIGARGIRILDEARKAATIAFNLNDVSGLPAWIFYNPDKMLFRVRVPRKKWTYQLDGFRRVFTLGLKARRQLSLFEYDDMMNGEVEMFAYQLFMIAGRENQNGGGGDV